MFSCLAVESKLGFDHHVNMNSLKMCSMNSFHESIFSWQGLSDTSFKQLKKKLISNGVIELVGSPGKKLKSTDRLVRLLKVLCFSSGP